jgi:Cytochrome c7 and related cytochrome c
MPQIFSRKWNIISRVSVFGSLAFVAAAFAIYWLVVRSPYYTEAGVIRQQPIPFSHKHHVGDVGLDCRYCHTSVEESSFAGIPATKICMNCHSQLWTGSDMLAPVRESYRTGKPLKWTRVHDLPDYVYFNHSIHIKKGVGCVSCHGRVDRMPLMWREKSLLMEWCVACHRNPKPHLRPPGKVFDMDWKPTGDGAELSDKLFLRNHVKSKTDCYTCHR